MGRLFAPVGTFTNLVDEKNALQQEISALSREVQEIEAQLAKQQSGTTIEQLVMYMGQ